MENKKYKLLLADDEPWVLMGIKKMLQQSCPQYEIVGEVNNGFDAMQIILNGKPDVVISDIRMPGMDGLELIEQIYNNGLNTQVVIISGYADFEYARRAFRFKAFDYILKPIENEVLWKCMDRLGKMMSEVNKNMNYVQTYVENLFELLQQDNNATIEKFLSKNNLNMPEDKFAVCNILMPYNNLEIVADTEIQQEGYLRYFRISTGVSKITVLFNYMDDSERQHIYQILEKLYPNRLCTGISIPTSEKAVFSEVMEQADIELYMGKFSQSNELLQYKEPDLNYEREILLKFERVIRENNFEEYENLVDELQVIYEKGNLQLDRLSFIYNQIITLNYKYIVTKDIDETYETLTYKKIPLIYNSINAFFYDIKNIRLLYKEKEVANILVKKIMENIDQNYVDDISLNLFAEKYNVSAGYLSRLIRKNTGYKYTELILEKRMNSAKKLLSDNTLSVMSIAEKVGYNDYFYFTKQFKKAIGISPSEYRKTFENL